MFNFFRKKAVIACQFTIGLVLAIYGLKDFDFATLIIGSILVQDASNKWDDGNNPNAF